MKFAIWIALLLAVTSVAGVLVQQFFPMRSEQEAAQLAERLPAPAFKTFVFLGLQDPFRAVWFRVLLGLLAASLIVCSSKRVRSAFKQAFHLHAVREPRALLLLHNSATVHHASPELFDAVVARLRRRLYLGRAERNESELVAALHQGGISRTGPVLLHLGILALVFGGLLSSLVGKRFFVEQSPGETRTLQGSDLQLRVDDFQIERGEGDVIKQYRSKLVLLQGGREVAKQEISVNHPMRYAGYNIYQASYSTDPSRASSLVFAVQAATGAVGHGDAASPHAGMAAHGNPTAVVTPDAALVHATMEGIYPVPGHPGFEFRVTRFFSHFVVGDQGPSNASRDFANPAAQLEILENGQPVGLQWSFLKFPGMGHAQLPFTLEMRDAQPAFATGLDVNTNPGTPLVWFGFALSTLGLGFAFLVQHRCVFLLARPEERGWTLWIAARSDRDPVAFAGEFQRLLQGVKSDARRARPSPDRKPAAPEALTSIQTDGDLRRSSDAALASSGM
jgi:cytochrome c biogenesis protein